MKKKHRKHILLKDIQRQEYFERCAKIYIDGRKTDVH